ncbi:MAG: hypothetical protein HDS50_01000 [Bacteroides sp.]|nr:hypothetical protein [Bacteroides sp.]
MEDNNKINLNIENYTGKEPIVVVFREGLASKELDQKAPEKIAITGVLSTPLDWLKKRVDTIPHEQACVFVERENNKIALVINETDPYKRGGIVGQAEFSELFRKFGINNPEVGWTPAKLGQFVRLNRAAFEDKEVCMKLVSALKNFKANAQSQIEKQHDPSGSRAEIYRQTVESNLPKSFTVHIPIFKGPEKVTFDVEFDHYLTDGEVFLQLVSPGAKEITDQWRDKAIDDVLEGIRKVAPDIAIIEA